MDNFHIKVVSENKRNFILAMEIAFSKHKEATHYQISETKGFILYWAKPDEGKKDIHPLPYPMTAKVATEFIWSWLEQAKYGPEPDHDGDNHKGWMVYNEDWGHVNNDFKAFVAILPTWAMYGK